MTNPSVQMANEVVGRIVNFPNERFIQTQCSMCLVYRKAIREYLKDYVNRNVAQESVSLHKLRAVLGE
jgi:hypothetical protein